MNIAPLRKKDEPMPRSTPFSTQREFGDDAVRLGAPLGRFTQGAGEAIAPLRYPFRDSDGSVGLRLWEGTTQQLGKSASDEASPALTLVCRNPGVVRSLGASPPPPPPPPRLAEAYFRGDCIYRGRLLRRARPEGSLAIPAPLALRQVPGRVLGAENGDASGCCLYLTMRLLGLIRRFSSSSRLIRQSRFWFKGQARTENRRCSAGQGPEGEHVAWHLPGRPVFWAGRLV